MKNTYFLLLFLAAVAFSCDDDDIDNLTEQDVNIELEETFDVDIPQASTATFSGSESFSLTDDDNIDNLERVEEVTINSVTFELDNLGNGQENITISGSIIIEGDFGTIPVPLTSTTLGTLASSPVTVNLDASATSSVGQALLDGETITVTFEATFGEVPVNFDLTLKINATATIDIV